MKKKFFLISAFCLMNCFLSHSDSLNGELTVVPGTLVFDQGASFGKFSIINTGNGVLSWHIKGAKCICVPLIKKGKVCSYGINEIFAKLRYRRQRKNNGFLRIITGAGDEKQVNVLRVKYALPVDHRLHYDQMYRTGHYMEWLYFTGHLLDVTTADVYGYEVNIFQVWHEDLQDFIYQTDIAISDIKNQKFHFANIVTTNHASVRFDSTKMETVWEYSDDHVFIRHRENSDIWELEADNGKTGSDYFAISLTLYNSHGNYYPETATGIIPMGEAASEGTEKDMEGLSYYYTHPALDTYGTLTVGTNTVHVEGDTWFDHQWGNFRQCPSNWDWFSLRLTNGVNMMIFKFNKEGDNTVTLHDLKALAYFGADGTLEYKTGKDAFTATPLREYTSTANGQLFRVDWRIVTPYGTYFVAPLLDEQVIADETEPYYEGLMEVRKDSSSGDVIGTAYLESSPVTK